MEVLAYQGRCGLRLYGLWLDMACTRSLSLLDRLLAGQNG